ANNDGGILNDGVETGDAPDDDLYSKDGEVFVIYDNDGRPAAAVWEGMTDAEKDRMLSDLSDTDQSRIVGVNEDDKGKVTITKYNLRDTEARDDEFDVDRGSSVTVTAPDLLENDRVLQDENGGASNITDVKSDYEGVTWNPETGEVTVATSKLPEAVDEIEFESTIRHDQGDRNKSGNTSESTGKVTVKVRDEDGSDGKGDEDTGDENEGQMALASAKADTL